MAIQLLVVPATAGKTACILDLGRTFREIAVGAPISLEANVIFHRTTAKVVEVHHR